MKKLLVFIFIWFVTITALFSQDAQIGGNWKAVIPTAHSDLPIWTLLLVNAGVRPPDVLEKTKNLSLPSEYLSTLNVNLTGFFEIRDNPPRLMFIGGSSGKVLLNWRGMTMEGNFEVTGKTAVLKLSFGFGDKPETLIGVVESDYLIFGEDNFFFSAPVVFGK